MPRLLAIVLIGLAGISIWVGFQIEARRDPIAWIFLAVIPLIIVGVLLYVTRNKG
jgi:hypothetical protein